MYTLISRQQRRCDFAVPTGPVEQYFLLLLVQVIRGERLADILVYTTGWIAEEKSLEKLGSGGFIYWSIYKSLFVQLNVNRRPAENSIDDFFAGPDGPPDLTG